MRILVIGGTGLVGSRLTDLLLEAGHELAVEPSVNDVDGESLAGARVVVDVTGPPPWDGETVLDSFRVSSRAHLAAEVRAGVEHHVALFTVADDPHPGRADLRARAVEEDAVRTGGVPYTIVRTTRSAEVDAVVTTLADVALGPPVNGVVELERFLGTAVAG